MSPAKLAAFLGQYAAQTDDAPPYQVRVRIGATKGTCRTWVYKPILLTGENPHKIAGLIFERLEDERGKVAKKAWVEVIQQGDTGITATFRPPIPVEVAEDEAEGEAAETGDILGQLKDHGIVGAVLASVIASGQANSAAADRLINTLLADNREKSERIQFLEQLAVDERNLRLADVQSYEKQLREGPAPQPQDAMAAAVGGFAGTLAQILGPRIERYMDAAEAAAGQAAGAPPSGAPNPSTRAPQDPTGTRTPTDDLQALIDALGIVLGEHPEALTEAQYRNLLGGMEALKPLATMRGWV